MTRQETGAWMPMYWADYLYDTQHLTTEEHGAYLLLIAAYWKRAKPLPDDDRWLAQVAKVPRKRWNPIRKRLSEFFDVSEGVWRHKRVESEILRSSERLRSARAAGRASAIARGATNHNHIDSPPKSPSKRGTSDCRMEGEGRESDQPPEPSRDDPELEVEAKADAATDLPPEPARPPTPARSNQRAAGTNPRAQGANPRAMAARAADDDRHDRLADWMATVPEAFRRGMAGLRQDLGEGVFTAWIVPLEILPSSNGQLRARAPSPFHRDRIEAEIVPRAQAHGIDLAVTIEPN